MSIPMLQKFDIYPPAAFERFKSKVEDELGLLINGNTGVAAKAGIELAYEYDQEKQALAFKVINAPLFQYGVVISQLQDIALDCLPEGSLGTLSS